MGDTTGIPLHVIGTESYGFEHGKAVRIHMRATLLHFSRPSVLIGLYAIRVGTSQ